jgi:hypothetical protein
VNAVQSISRGAAISAPLKHSLSSLVIGALQDGYHHLLLETDVGVLQPLETMHLSGSAFLPAHEAVFLTPEELDAHLAFLEFTGLRRALLELRVMECDVLELRVMEW